MKRVLVAPLALLLCLFAATCGKPAPASDAPAASSPTPSATPDEPLPNVPTAYDLLPPETRSAIHGKFTGDHDDMIQRRVSRAGVAINRTH